MLVPNSRLRGVDDGTISSFIFKDTRRLLSGFDFVEVEVEVEVKGLKPGGFSHDDSPVSLLK